MATEETYPKTFVILTQAHAMEVPEVRPIMGNILDFMHEVGGGAVLVRLLKPRRYGGPVRWEITRINNGPDLSRRSGWNVPDYTPGGFELTGVGGNIAKPKKTKAA